MSAVLRAIASLLTEIHTPHSLKKFIPEQLPATRKSTFMVFTELLNLEMGDPQVLVKLRTFS